MARGQAAMRPQGDWRRVAESFIVWRPVGIFFGERFHARTSVLRRHSYSLFFAAVDYAPGLWLRRFFFLQVAGTRG